MVMKLKASYIFHWSVFIFLPGKDQTSQKLSFSKNYPLYSQRTPFLVLVSAAFAPSTTTSRWSHRPAFCWPPRLGVALLSPASGISCGDVGRELGGRSTSRGRGVGTFSFSGGSRCDQSKQSLSTRAVGAPLAWAGEESDPTGPWFPPFTLPARLRSSSATSRPYHFPHPSKLVRPSCP